MTGVGSWNKVGEPTWTWSVQLCQGSWRDSGLLWPLSLHWGPTNSQRAPSPTALLKGTCGP